MVGGQAEVGGGELPSRRRDIRRLQLLALYLSVALPARGALLRLDDAGRYHVDVGVRTPGRAFHIWTQVRLGGGWVDAETVHPSITFGQSPADAVRRGLTIQ